MPPLPSNDYEVGPTDELTPALWNAVFASIAARIRAREVLEASFEALITGGTQAALDLIQVNVGPQLETLTDQIDALEEQLAEILGGGTAANSLNLGGKAPSFYLALANATGILPVEKVDGVDTLIDAAIAALLAGPLGGDPDFAATTAAALANRLRIDVVQALTAEQSARGRASLKLDAFNRPRNRIINGSMRFNQRAAGAVDYVNSSGFPVDRFVVSASAGGTLRAQQVAVETPGGSPNRLRLTVQGIKAALGASDYFGIEQSIEGSEIADARFGQAGAKQLILRIGCRSSVAGTFGVVYRNAAKSLSFVGSITIGAGEVNTDLVRTVIVTPSTTGTWLKDTGIGGTVSIALAAGATLSAAAGWQTGNFPGLTGQTNLMANAGATFELSDVALYVDHDGNGIVPPYELPSFAEELRACRRFFQIAPINIRVYAPAGTSNWGAGVKLDPPMRTLPSAATYIAIPGTNYSGGTNFTWLGVTGASPQHIDFQWQAGTGDAYVFGYGVPLSAEF